MAKQKFYAIKAPDGGKIVLSWEECLELTHGVKGVLFRAFPTRQEAANWLNGVSAPAPKGLRIYVDGSFLEGYPKAGWGFIVVENDQEVAHGSGVTVFDAESRNIDGEAMASYQAMRWLENNDRTAVICHDYEGVARWAKGEWKAKSSIAKKYVEACRPLVHRVSFEKVAAHTGVKWNEAVDQLAKNAIARAKKAEGATQAAKAPPRNLLDERLNEGQNAAQAAQVKPSEAPAESTVAEPVTEAVRAKAVPEPIKDPKTGQMSLPL